MNRLAWGKKVSKEFRAKVLEICRDFQWSNTHGDWLMACMAFESAETFSPSIRNAAGSGATGLIQFMPSTAIGLGTTVEHLAGMSAEDQLLYVKKYFLPYYHKIRSLSDMYMAILLPKYVGKDDTSILFAGKTIAYRQNSGLDRNHDGTVTKLEATLKVQAKLQRGLLPEFCFMGEEECP